MTTEPVQRKLHFILEDHYGIKPKDNFTFSYFSMANEVFFLTDKNGKRYVLKNCLKNRAPALIAAELALIEHLNANGCGAPVALPAKDGAKALEYNGDTYVMTRHMKGKSLSWNVKLRRRHFLGAIEGMARYHRAASTLDPAIDTDRIKSWEYQRTLDWVENLKTELQADTSGRASVRNMLGIIDDYRELARTLPEHLPLDKVEQCERLMIHGDFHAFNVMYRFGRFHACYDFDFIRRDLKLFDICWHMNFVARRFYRKVFGDKIWSPEFNPSPEQVLDIETKALAWFARHYRRFWKLSDLEISLLPGMKRALALYNLRFFSLEHAEEECLEHHQWFSWQLKTIREREATYRQAVAAVIAGARS